MLFILVIGNVAIYMFRYTNIAAYIGSPRNNYG